MHLKRWTPVQYRLAGAAVLLGAATLAAQSGEIAPAPDRPVSGQSVSGQSVSGQSISGPELSDPPPSGGPGSDTPGSAAPVCAAPVRVASPLDAAESLRYIQLDPGLKVELVSAEPEVVDPIAIRFDEAGRLWVIELRDYPNGPPAGEPPLSRIRVLEDRDGDGRFETARTFADRLLFPTGMQPWRGGVLVTLAGKVMYLKDTTGDGRADLSETWFAGFAQHNPQLRANHPRLALDGRVYVANGLRGGEVVSSRQPDAPPVSISGRDFSFDPLTGHYEAVSGNGQFGMTFDDFGRRFICNNRQPLMHVVIDERYARRNPAARLASLVHDVAASGDDSRIFPLSPAWVTSTLHEGQFTAACGALVYRGDSLPGEYYGNSLTCDPTGSLVHREIVRPLGASFQGGRAIEGRELFATPDEWCRPVSLDVGPDGALYVVDMYRAVIEHPEWMPEELRRRTDLRHGDDRGRIYRISPEENGATSTDGAVAGGGRGRTAVLPSADSARIAPAALVDLLEHPNVWQRETAARLLLERQDRSACPPLVRLASESKSPAARAQALWLLERLDGLSDEQLAARLSDEHPGVREQTVILAERRVHDRDELAERLIRAAGDGDPRARFQVALSLGELLRPDSVSKAASRQQAVLYALASIALADADDVWTRRAVATAVGPHAGRLLARVLCGTAEQPRAGHEPLCRELAELAAAETPEVALASIAEAQPALARSSLVGLGEGLARRGKSLGEVIERMGETPARGQVNTLLRAAARDAADEQLDSARREQAVALLRFSPLAGAADTLLELAARAAGQSVQLAALGALSALRDERIGPALLSDLSSQTPAVRRAMLDVLIRDEQRAALLLDQVEAGRIKPSEIDAARWQQLLRHGSQALRQRAQALWEGAARDRAAVLATYRADLSRDADPRRGEALFEKNCATCHRIGSLGVNVGPDIGDSRVKTPEQLLVDILDPNRAIDANYIGYAVELASGEVLTGIITAETGESVTLRQPEGKQATLLRGEIVQLRSTGLSLMPEGLERDLTPAQLADLIAFVKNWRYLDGRVPLE